MNIWILFVLLATAATVVAANECVLVVVCAFRFPLDAKMPIYIKPCTARNGMQMQLNRTAFFTCWYRTGTQRTNSVFGDTDQPPLQYTLVCLKKKKKPACMSFCNSPAAFPAPVHRMCAFPFTPVLNVLSRHRAPPFNAIRIYNLQNKKPK